ncbi:ADP-ribose glycohydrolase OARD1-like [Trichomycterus rosablanca]|uniref:ADP-ribose glycohydrolase OARD1-like n=1 Tax=Trichomycterus rosablanca TaxID=2290929 RepID=UPI002F350303
MGAGIAVDFKRRFGRVPELRKQSKETGQCAVLEDDNRYIYYLVTKRFSTDRPEYSALKQSLTEMKDHCLTNGVIHVSMPKIGCGLDRLKWRKVRSILKQVFKHSGISITIYVKN